ncbi:MAG: CoA-binding protein [Desulfovibrionales bacterium]|nr:CoA-binding protein [Desulfovibrionales bacterium]
MRDMYLDALFAPQALAILGDFDVLDSPARNIMSNLEGWGYQGKIIAVNCPSGQLEEGSVASLSCAPPVDLAIICLDPVYVSAVVAQLADCGVKAVIVTSAGFRDIGGQGYYLEQELIQIAAQRNITLLGPNCIGVASWSGRMNASLVDRLPRQGKIAFFSPSASMCQAVLDWAAREDVGFSKFASLGNRALLDEAAMLRFLADDPETSVIAGYLEGMNNGRRFARSSQTITREKPVLMLQGGMTEFGQQAITGHVGALTGSELAYQVALKQAGIIQVDNLAVLFDLARLFGMQPLPSGPELVIITNSGGAGILAADGLAGTALHMAQLGQRTQERLRQILPVHARLGNPLDVGSAASPQQIADVLSAVLHDPRLSMVLAVIAPGTGVDVAAIASALGAVPRGSKHVVAVCLVGQEGGLEAKRLLHAQGLPCFSYPQAALTGLSTMLCYAQWKKKPYPVEVCYRRDKTKAEHFIRECLGAGKTELFGFEMQPLLQAYEIQFPHTELARTSKSAVKIAKRLGKPVVLKIASPDIEYKRDVDGVEVGLESPDAVRRAFGQLTARAQCLRQEAFVSGCLVQEMIPGRPCELRIHVQRDPHFGPLIRFGLSGYQAEIFQDFSLRLAPLSLDDAADMVRETKAFALLKRERGRDALDLRALEDLLLTISQMTLDFPEIYTLECDPVLATARGVWVAGARMTLAQAVE